MKRSSRLVSLLVWASVAVGCGAASKPSTDGGRDAGKDAGKEVAVESKPEAAAEVGDAAPAAEVGDAVPAAEVGDAPAAEVGDAAPEVNPACMTIPTNATRTVHLRITADNECDVYVNGALTGTTTSWPSPVTMDVSLFVHPGRANVIAVEARNTSSQGGPDRGIIGQLEDLTDGGNKVVVITDATWRSWKVTQSGWQGVLFDDSTWNMATVVGDHGSAPWGALLGTSTAKWLWTAPVPDATADKPDQETGYFRKRFFFSADGEVTSTPGCPLVSPNG